MTDHNITLFITTVAASLLSFKWLLLYTKHKLCSIQCLNSLTRFHSLLQVDYVNGLMKGMVNEGIGGDFEHSQRLFLKSLREKWMEKILS